VEIICDESIFSYMGTYEYKDIIEYVSHFFEMVVFIFPFTTEHSPENGQQRAYPEVMSRYQFRWVWYDDSPLHQSLEIQIHSASHTLAANKPKLQMIVCIYNLGGE
jgi:hypothetical protein